jgi:hypothetical protein
MFAAQEVQSQTAYLRSKRSLRRPKSGNVTEI